MNATAIFNSQFVQVSLPMMVTFVVAIWFASHSQNKRLDDLKADINRRFDAVEKRLDAIETRLTSIEGKLSNHETRITVLEDRSSHIVRGGG